MKALNKLNTLKITLDDLIKEIEEWWIEAIQVYQQFKDVEKLLKKATSKITEQTIEEVRQNPEEYKVFSIANRKTYQFKENKEYNEKYKELKEIESKLKQATDMSLDWNSFIDENGEVISPINVKYTEYLVYKPN